MLMLPKVVTFGDALTSVCLLCAARINLKGNSQAVPADRDPGNSPAGDSFTTPKVGAHVCKSKTPVLLHPDLGHGMLAIVLQDWDPEALGVAQARP